MGWPGSKVFNANLFPIGKPSLSVWPSHYNGLLGVTRAEYLARTRRPFRRARRVLQATASRPSAAGGGLLWKKLLDAF